MVNLKGSYLAELTHELTNMDIDGNSITRHGDFVDDEDVNVKAIRLSRYATGDEDATSYNIYARNLTQQSLTELSFMSKIEYQQVLKRFDILAERFTKAWELYFKHFQLFYEGKFSSLEFEWAFFRLFNMPVRRSGVMDAPNFGDLKTTNDFWSDLHDALMYKQGMLLEVMYDLRVIYDQPQPTEKTETPKNEEGLATKPRLTLDAIFNKVSKYKDIMDLLVDKGQCQPHTYIWIDRERGSKGFLSALIKYLHYQGYLQWEPTSREIQEIIEETFRYQVGKDTIDKAKPEEFDFKFIPPASADISITQNT